MPQRLPTKSLTVADLLADAFRFVVPAYQRAYSWTRDEAGQLLEDLMSAAGIDDEYAGEPDYFLGTLLVMDPAPTGWPDLRSSVQLRVLEIVDGQQRLVTLSILAAVLRDLDRAPESEQWSRLDACLAIPGTGRRGQPPRRPRVEMRGKDRAFLERFVTTPGATIEVPMHDDAPGVGPHALLDVRELFLSELGTMAPDQRRRLASYLCDRAHFVVIFSSDVDRAHKFFEVLNNRGRPLLRSDILRAEVMSGLGPGEARQVVDAWDTASAGLGPRFDRFFSHLKTLQGLPRPQVISAVRAIVADSGGPAPFVLRYLAPLASAYRDIIDSAAGPGSNLPIEIQRRLVFLGRLNGEEWVPAALLAVRAFRDGSPNAVALLGEIDRLAHLMRLLLIGADKRGRRFAPVVAAIRSGQDIDSNSPLVQFTREEQRNFAFNLRALWRRSPAFSKLLLLRLSDEIDGGLTRVDPAMLSVEHVLPQRPAPDSEWRQLFPEAESREALTQCLGNLILVSPRQNEAARNQDFPGKREIYERGDPSVPRLNLIADVIGARRWGPAEVLAREKRTMLLLRRVFRIELDVPVLVG